MRKLGHALVLVAMVGYAISVFTLDFYAVRTAPTELGLTYFDLLTGQGGASSLAVVGGVLATFGAPLLIVTLDVCCSRGVVPWPLDMGWSPPSPHGPSSRSVPR